MPISIRTATIDDAAGIANVHVNSWRSTYRGIMPDELLDGLSVVQRETVWRRNLTNQPSTQRVLVAEASGEIVGFAAGGAEQSGQHPEIAETYAIYLLAEHQRKGIGRALMLPMVEHFASEGFGEMLIWVAEKNPSRAFYEALGGTVHGEKSDTFGGKEIREVSYYWDDLPGLLQRLKESRVPMLPAKLKPGDTIRVISPATSLAIIPDDQRKTAIAALGRLGLKVTFSKHAEELDAFNSSSVTSRIADLHAAFSDHSVQAILTTLGGYNSNQMLRHLDYDLIRAHPKVLCGYSDITALGTAIYAKTGLVTYSGPHFTTFGMQKGIDYTWEYFRRCLMQNGAYEVRPADTWSDDAWYLDQEHRTFVTNEGRWVIREGEAEGRLIGGNASTFVLLHGTEYMPSLGGCILMLEDDFEASAHHFDRYLQSVIHQPGFEGVRALVIGRFQNASKIDRETITRIVESKPELAGIPIIANVDFGHTTPQFMWPIGGTGRLSASGNAATLTIVEH